MARLCFFRHFRYFFATSPKCAFFNNIHLFFIRHFALSFATLILYSPLYLTNYNRNAPSKALFVISPHFFVISLRIFATSPHFFATRAQSFIFFDISKLYSPLSPLNPARSIGDEVVHTKKSCLPQNKTCTRFHISYTPLNLLR